MKNVIVNENDKGKRLDIYIAENFNELSRTMIKKLIESNNILVNGKSEKVSYKVQANDNISIDVPEAKETKLKAQEIPLDIIYEDSDIIVVNKPKGMVVHPANGNPDGTLVNAILSICKNSLSGIGGELRPGIVHRLDKDTSGLIIVAKNDKAHINMSEQIKEKNIKKPDVILVDALTGIDTLGIPYKSIIHGDAISYSIACASIIAKVTRDRIMRKMDEMYPQYGFAKHKGYGTAAHMQAIRENGLCPLHRRSFVKNII